MTDKKKIRNYVCELLKDAQNGFGSTSYNMLKMIIGYIDSLPEELKKCMYAQPNYTNEDRKVLCEDCKEKCEFNQVKESAILQHKEETRKENCNSLTKEPVSEDLHTAAKEFANSITEKIGYRLQLRRAFVYGAQWQKERFEKNRLKHCNSITNEQAELKPDDQREETGEFFNK